MDVNMIGAHLEENAEDGCFHVTVSQKHGGSCVAVTDEYFRGGNGEVCGIDLIGSAVPEAAAGNANEDIQDGFRQVIFGPVVMNCYKVPVVEDHDGPEEIHGTGEGHGVLPCKDINSPGAEGYAGKQQEGYADAFF